MKLFIYPYIGGSKSIKALKEALGVDLKVIKRTNSKFKPMIGKLIINWGSTTSNTHIGTSVFNPQSAVKEVCDKLKFFNLVGMNCRCVPWTTDVAVVQQWLDAGSEVFARTTLVGHSGAGIVQLLPGNNIPPAPLYTKYVKKDSEWRVHMTDDGLESSVLHVQKKLRSRDTPDDKVNWKVRNHKGGFIYASNTDNIGEVPEDVLTQAKLAMEATNLDFGAVDVIYNKRENKAYILEINTAPGLTGTTVAKYANYFKSLIE